MKIDQILLCDNQEFISQSYLFLLNREVDAEGYSHYSKRLAFGYGKLSVIHDLVNSEEGKIKFSNLSDDVKRDIRYLLKLEKRARFLSKWLYFPRILFTKWNMLEASLSNQGHASLVPQHVIYADQVAKQTDINFEKVDSNQLTCAVRVTGGLGDALIIARFMRDLADYLNTNFVFDVYFHSPQNAKIFFEHLKGFRALIHEDVFPNAVPYYDFSLLANQFVTFANEHIDFKKLSQLYPKVLEVFANIEQNRKPINKYIEQHPNLDGAFADLAIKSGHKRHTYLHYMAGLDYKGDAITIRLNKELLKDHGLIGVKYITVHDGWDTMFKFKGYVDRPTKALPTIYWQKIVAELKQAYPTVKIVQLGGNTGNEIPGVDLNLRNKLKLSESISILAKSILHVDTESGLVHVAAALGVRSRVYFGPTNIEWFGYAQNENIAPKECGNCWWSTDTWMEKCPAGFVKPVCMHSHTSG